ncbi:MAG TPA: cell wall biosynthesis glycosyltransferase [Bryobacteraceae bacterium]|nr:cell wall biosynthesis glycosyltransferase [Bryobacteraceae bacterium]
MGQPPLPEEARRAAEVIQRADIVIGIPSYNNARTIGHVVRAAYAGLAKYFPQLTAVVINSDGGSTDNTREAVLSARVEDSHLMLLSTPLLAAHRLSFPYHGVPGKGSAFRLVFQMAKQLDAKVCAVVDSDLRSITPEWIDLLIRPILFAGFDFVAPYYQRHKYDGTITNSIVYPFTRMLYGVSVRQPIGGEFGVSARLIRRYLDRQDWETDVARFGIDIWMTTIALAEGFRVCQSFLGAKLHDAKDPGTDLSAMLQQVVGSVFTLMREYAPVWQQRAGSSPAELFGFRFDVGLDPIFVNVDRMVNAFRRGCDELGEVWETALDHSTLGAVRALAASPVENGKGFHLSDGLWTDVILEFACAYQKHPIARSMILRSLTPLYLARVASFVRDTENLVAAEVEEKIEQLCVTFENLKPRLIARWNRDFIPGGSGSPQGDAAPRATNNAKLEVTHD